MKKNSKAEETKGKTANGNNEQIINEAGCCEGNCSENDNCSCDETAECIETVDTVETPDLQEELKQKVRQCDEYFRMLQRTAAEFDNYKKRTVREKEALYTSAMSDAVKAFLPVADSIERAREACGSDTEPGVLKDGIELIYRQIKEAMKKLDIQEIKGPGEKFNPELHNAVMYIEDDSYDTNVIAEEFQKGYMYKDRVIRHSMVKVAN